MILQVREIRVRKESKHSPWYKQLYLPVCERLIGQLQFRFNQASLVITTKGRDYFVSIIACCPVGCHNLVLSIPSTMSGFIATRITLKALAATYAACVGHVQKFCNVFAVEYYHMK